MHGHWLVKIYTAVGSLSYFGHFEGKVFEMKLWIALRHSNFNRKCEHWQCTDECETVNYCRCFLYLVYGNFITWSDKIKCECWQYTDEYDIVN